MLKWENGEWEKKTKQTKWKVFANTLQLVGKTFENLDEMIPFPDR
jgi:hypothetical protein